MRAIWATLALLLISTSQAQAKCVALEIPMVTDTLTTAIALGTHVATEANPLGFAGATVAKAVYYLATPQVMTPEEQRKVDHLMASALWAATANNLLILATAAAPIVAVPVGIAAGIIYYTTQETCRLTDPTEVGTGSDPAPDEKPHSTANTSDQQ